MSSDRSRTSDQPRKLYTGIVAQQGRVLLDRDINDLQEIALARLAADACDIIGPCGTPDDGFRISAPNAAPGLPFWTAPAPPPGSPPVSYGAERDFLIGGGTMYLGGQRVELPAMQNGEAVTYSYDDQPVLPPSAVTPTGPQSRLFRAVEHELAYLDVTLTEVSAVEDPDLLEVALGGPDTTQRLRLLPRVQRQSVDATDCATAWEQMLANWEAQGLVFDAATMRLKPAMRMQVGIAQTGGSGDPCDPVAAGGYLGADNQLLRVQVSSTTKGDFLYWGYDNASFIYRIASVTQDRLTITLTGAPPDEFHIPQTGQIVEILSTASVIAREINEADPTGQSSILRVNAEAKGGFYALAKPYSAGAQGDQTSTIVLTEPLDPSFDTSLTVPLFLRVWQAQLGLTLNTAIALDDSSTGSGITTGLTVTFSGTKMPADGAYWQIAARPSTPQGVYPEDLLNAPQCADGPVRYVCPLAVIDWTGTAGPVISDCRNVFENLVTLSRRKPGCCTVAISPRDIATGASLQQLIDKAATQADTVTVCLAAGAYVLPEPLRLGREHDGMRLESCGGPAVFSADSAARAELFIEGLINLSQATGITLHGLTLQPLLLEAPAALVKELTSRLAAQTTKEEAASLLRAPYVGFGIRAFASAGLTLDRCNITFTDTRRDTTTDLFAAAVFLQGAAKDFCARDCTFNSRIPLTYTALSEPTNFRDFVVSPDISKALENAAPAAPAPAAPPPPAPAAAPAPAATPAPIPAAFDITQEVQLGNALNAILANRAGATYGSRQRPCNATAAIIALSYIKGAVSNQTNDALNTIGITASGQLGDAAVCGNQMTGFTFGTFISAEFSTLRLNDNRLTGGIGGFWAGLLNPITPNIDTLTKGTAKYYDTITNFEEWQLLFGFAAILPPRMPPAKFETSTNATDRNLTSETRAAALALGINATVIVSGNHVSTGKHPAPPPDPALANPAVPPGSCALMLWLDNTVNRAVLERSDISSIITGNHLVNADAEAPTALLVLPYLQPCAIAGNIILNQPGLIEADRETPSLWVVINGSQDTTQPLAVTGNVLRGLSDLNFFNRDAPAARTGWISYNADPY